MSTLQQVAFRAGCSLATASRVLNRNGPVSDEMVRRVRRAAAELGYRTGGRRRQVGRGRSIGVLIPSITNPVFASSLSSIQNRMLVAGHGVLIAQSNYDPAREADAVASLLQRAADRPDPHGLRSANTARLLLSSALPPTVLLGNLPTARFPAAVTTDNRGAGRRSTDHLLIAWAIAASCSSPVISRLPTGPGCAIVGYFEAMEEAGCHRFEAMQIPFVDGFDQLDLSVPCRALQPTAIIASNDLLALGVIGALQAPGAFGAEAISRSPVSTASPSAG